MRGTMDGDVAAERQLIAVERLLARIPQPQRATPVNFLAPPSRTDPPYTHLFRWFSPLFCGLNQLSLPLVVPNFPIVRR